jgi:hypothetical protein
LLKAGLLKDGAKLQHTDRRGNHKLTYHGFIRLPGQIEVEVAGKKERFTSPSSAANALSGRHQSGWLWWAITSDDGTEIPLSQLRLRLTDGR